MERFALSEVQAKAILEMRLQRLTGLQREELMNEYKDLLQKIEFYRSILENAEVLRSELKREIAEIRDNFATPRRTEVLREALTDIDIEDLIPDEEVVITLSRRGYMKRTGLENYQQQKRGGKGIAALHTSDDDYVQEFLSTTNHQYLCLFTNKGRMHQLKVHQVPEGSRTAKGVHINNLLPLEENEWVTTVLALREFAEDKFFLFITKRGMIKRSSASLYAKCRKTGLMAVGLREDDELVVVRPIRDNNHIVLATADGFSIRLPATMCVPWAAWPRASRALPCAGRILWWRRLSSRISTRPPKSCPFPPMGMASAPALISTACNRAAARASSTSR